jgi:DNA polymerase-3 subunit beta
MSTTTVEKAPTKKPTAKKPTVKNPTKEKPTPKKSEERPKVENKPIPEQIENKPIPEQIANTHNICDRKTAFNIQRQKLADAVSVLSKFMDKSSTIREFTCYRLYTEDNKIKICGGNLESHAFAVIGDSRSANFDFYIESKILGKILRHLSSVIVFEIEPSKANDTAMLTINSSFKLEVFNMGEQVFDLEVGEVISSFTFDKSDFEFIKNHADFLSNDELRATMTGIYIGPKAIVGTDAHRMYKLTHEYNVKAFIAPKEILQLPVKPYFVQVTESRVILVHGSLVMSYRLVDGKYPDFNAVIPDLKGIGMKEDKTYAKPRLPLEISRLSLTSLCEKALIMASSETKQIELKVSDGVLTVSSQKVDFSQGYRESIPCISPNLEIAFNGSFLIELLKGCSGETITLNIYSESSPATLIDQQSLKLLMPTMRK